MGAERRVLYVVNHAVPYGANVALLNLLDGIRNEGFVPYCSVGHEGALCEELEKRGVEYRIISHEFSIYPRINAARDLVAFPWRLAKLHAKNRHARVMLADWAARIAPELIHTNIGPTSIGYDVARSMKIPHVWHLREYQFDDFGMRPFPSEAAFVRKLRASGNHNIAITHGISRKFRLQPSNSRVIWDGVIHANCRPPIEFHNEYFLFVGRLEDAKGIRMVLSAFARYKAMQNGRVLRLKIAGDGDPNYVAELREYAEVLKLDCLDFLGFRKDVFELMKGAKALIVASRCEGFGFITVEAMAHGCLVIGRKTGGTREILEPQGLGLLFGDEVELASALDVVASAEDTDFKEIKIAAQIEATDKYSVEAHVSRISSYYREILEGARC